MIAIELVESPVRMKEPPRCSDYDTDCAGVMDHAFCHAGADGLFDPADGYCPYLGKTHDH